MARFLIRRGLQGLFVMWLMTVTVFLIFFVGPGPAFVARVLAGRQATPAQVAAVAHRLLLDRPIYVQYGHFIWLLLHGNLGYDYYHSQSVNTVLKAAFPITLSLVVGAAILWLAMGLASGIVSAVKTRSLWDRTYTTLAQTFYSMPTFELGLLLPWLTLALVSAATYTRLTRGSMLDVFGEDYIRTARSKGMSERRLIFRHNLRSALTPVVTQFGLDVGVLIGGAVITETVFGLPGIGYTAVHAINQQDLPVVIGVVIVASAGVIIAKLLVDILYAVLDPRVRLH